MPKLDDFISGLEAVECDACCNDSVNTKRSTDCCFGKQVYLGCDNPKNYVYSTNTYTFPLSNEEVTKDENGRLYIEKKFNDSTSYSDMISHIKSNVAFATFIGGREYKIDRYLKLCSPFHELVIRMYVDQPNVPDVVTLSIRKHFFTTNVRGSIMKNMNVADGLHDGPNIRYYDGQAFPVENE
jgi:hypothetical protein